MFSLLFQCATLSDLSQTGLSALNTAFQIQTCMKSILPIQIFCLVFLFYSTESYAEWHATLTMTTNNVGRWFTKNNNNPALQANADYQHRSGLFVGGSISNIDFKEQDDPAHVEIIPYLGWSFKLADQWRLDTQWSHYWYDGKIFGHSADYNELYLLLHYQDIISASLTFADDYYGSGSYLINYQVTSKYPVSDRLEFSASFGYAQNSTAFGSDYPYWNAGFTYFYKFIALDLRYMDAAEISVVPVGVANLHERFDPPLINTTAVFSISMGF